MFLVTLPGFTVLVDPCEAAPAIAAIDRLGGTLDAIFITHGHADHLFGLEALRQRYHPAVIGPVGLPVPLDQAIMPGGVFECGGVPIQPIDTPGHAAPHVAYFIPQKGWLFSGDCLFGAGCGRLAGNTAGIMWESLQRLMELPDDTLVYFGHEYTLENLAFAAAVEPDNPSIAARRAQTVADLAAGRYSAPSTLALEKATNPFLRPSAPGIRQTCGMETAPAAGIFALLRDMKSRGRTKP